ncbi:MurR/RpiR family transcriptional regulator [Microbispora sp. CA-135349]|uniref:MurR/RpiR family transcriptional regulator n=1 Tax=Microbispora sp. CA-135349 TaxID=3239953 RepID=UPI003D8E697C
MNTGHNADDGPPGHRDGHGDHGEDRDGHGDHGEDRDGRGDDGDAASRLLRLFEGRRLTPVQRRIAHCLAQHAAEAPFLSSIEVAELAGVSQPSVTRFAMALGYDGYPALRRRFRELGVRPGGGATGRAGGPRPGPAKPLRALSRDSRDSRDLRGSGGLGGSGGSGSSDRPSPRPDGYADAASAAPNRDVARGKGPGEGYRRAVLAEIDNLRALARSLDDPGPVAAAARLLAASRPLLVLGLRAGAAQAAGFAYFAAKVHPDVRLLQEAGSLLADRVEQAAAAGATALLCFALPRYPAELGDALRSARTAGLSVVTVADRRVPSLAGLSDVLLAAAVGTHLVFDTACAPMMLGRVLLEAMCDELPGAQARLEAFEASAAARGVFLID